MDTVSVRYIVDDVDAAVEFYVTHLAFDVELRPAPGFAMLSRGPLRLLLNAPGAGGAGRAAASDAVPAPGGWSRFQIAVTDLDAMIDRLREGGVTFRTDMVDGKGGRQVLVEDPAGNPIELFEPSDA
ncbi:MAG: VOC family protein [Actinobacteria bacterium]|nr:VOC family protein [Actinomycetota bacterium]